MRRPHKMRNRLLIFIKKNSTFRLWEPNFNYSKSLTFAFLNVSTFAILTKHSVVKLPTKVKNVLNDPLSSIFWLQKLTYVPRNICFAKK